MGLKYQVNKDFFNEWSAASAYILGLLYADGNLLDVPQIRAKYFSLTSTDFELVDHMRSLTSSSHKIYVTPATRTRKEKYLLRIGSHTMYEQLLHLGLTPAKSHSLLFPQVPSAYLPLFIRGYFDGDGCAFIEKNPKGQVKKLLSIFTCGSRQFLEALHSHLVRETGIKGTGLYKHGSTKGTYQLRYSTRDSLRLFLLMYNPLLGRQLYLKRKYDIFRKYLELRGLDIESIPSVLDARGPVANEERIGLQNRHERVQLPPGPPIGKALKERLG